MFKIYIIGVLVSLLLTLLTEQYYFGAWSVSSFKIKDILEDVGISLLSWICVLFVLLFYIGEWMVDFNMYGYGKDMEEFESQIKEEIENNSEE